MRGNTIKIQEHLPRQETGSIEGIVDALDRDTFPKPSRYLADVGLDKEILLVPIMTRTLGLVGVRSYSIQCYCSFEDGLSAFDGYSRPA